MELKNYAHYVCTKAIERLVEIGVDHFFIAPGSRSTPIVSAIVRNPHAKKFLGVDERSLGFMALGYGKRAQKPGVVVVTSGTAVSNLYPSVTESFMSSVPMLVITADRPYELRDCGANQTIAQHQIFANHILKSFDLAPPSLNVTVEQIVAIVEQAARYTYSMLNGPVHVNWQLREPLANLAHAGEPDFELRSMTTKTPQKYFARPRSEPSDEFIRHLDGKGLIVVGELLPDLGQREILALSQQTGWPIYADVASNLRFNRDDQLIKYFDIKLLNKSFSEGFAPSVIIKFGSRIVSKRFWQWIERRPDACVLLSIDEYPERIDQTGRFSHWCVGDVRAFVKATLAHLPKKNKDATLVPGRAIDALIAEFLETSANNEAYVAARIVAGISEPATLFLSSGMPIRDVDQFASATSVPIDVFVNRGASGIDGIISTATGIAVADTKPLMLLIGDVAFVHDTNGLMLIKHSQQPVLIIVINNGGGGIFHFLPIAHEPDIITPYLDTPNDVSIKLLCEAHGVPHITIKNPRGLHDAMKIFFASRTSMVVEIIIDRSENVRLHQELYRKAASLSKDVVLL